MNEERRKCIKTAVLGLLMVYGDATLPMPIKDITKSLSNCRLIPYSKCMRDCDLSYEQMIDFTGTEDACTDYYCEANKYIIYYNDTDDFKTI